MQATVFNLAGEAIDTVQLSDAVFGVVPNPVLIRQAVLRQQANARQGTSSTKTRADVRGGGRKPWRQKGTGRARQGSNRSPQWTHGGVVFGPHPRSYEQDMPRKMRRLAIRGVLSDKLADGRLVIVDSFDDLEPRTKAMAQVLESLDIGDRSALIMTPDIIPPLELASGNLPRVKTMRAYLLSIVDVLRYDYLVLPRASISSIEGILGNTGGRRKVALKGHAAPQAARVTGQPAAPEAAARVETGAPTEAIGTATSQLAAEPVTEAVVAEPEVVEPVAEAAVAEPVAEPETPSPAARRARRTASKATRNIAAEPTGEVVETAEATTTPDTETEPVQGAPRGVSPTTGGTPDTEEGGLS